MLRDTREVRATGLQGDPSSEIIEILDDDTDAFGDRAPNHTVNDEGGTKWAGPLAALALIGLIGFGVATSSSSGDEQNVAPVTSHDGVSPTTQPASTTTQPAAPPVPYYAANPPQRVQDRVRRLLRRGRVQPRELPVAGQARGDSHVGLMVLGRQPQRSAEHLRPERVPIGDRPGIGGDRSLPVGQTNVQFSNNRSSSVVTDGLRLDRRRSRSACRVDRP